MNKKIVGMLVCTLFIGSAFIPIISAMTDQQQTNTSTLK